MPLPLTSNFTGFPGATPRMRSLLGLVMPSIVQLVSVLVDAAAIAIDAGGAGHFTFVAASDAVREFSVPTNGVTGQHLTIILSNTSGGPLTNTTFAAAIRRGTLTLPATGFQREYTLAFDGATWAITNQSATDIPN